ncbi:MAG TPA: response regulator [Anaerolineae bacterium]|nr:response regulator [Anaerolineae bacterium]
MTVTILTVDDEPSSVNLFKLMISIEKPDWVFHGAYNGQEALAIVANNQVDLVILDIMMPGMDGIEVCRRLRAEPKTAKIPIAMFTALDRPDVRQQAMEVGATEFWVKPLPPSKLVGAIDRLLAEYK